MLLEGLIYALLEILKRSVFNSVTFVVLEKINNYKNNYASGVEKYA